MPHNGRMIRGLAYYTPDSVEDLGEGLDWQQTHLEALPRVRELFERTRTQAGAFVWLGLFEPTHGELTAVAEVFDLPALQVEDAVNPRQRPKVEWGGSAHAFALIKVLDYVDASSDVLTGQVSVFVGPGYAVSVRFGQTASLLGIRQRMRADAGLRAHGSPGVLYAILDSTIDHYLAVTDEITIDIEEIEDAVFARDVLPGIAQVLYRLKRENVEIRRAVTPLVGTAHDFISGSMPEIPAGLRDHFADMGEHLLRADETAAAADALLLTLFNSSTQLLDLRQNSDMRKISAWVAIAAVPTMVAGIYGMNFEFMPELHQPWGYPAVMAGMAVACFSLFRAFKRAGWL